MTIKFGIFANFIVRNLSFERLLEFRGSAKRRTPCFFFFRVSLVFVFKQPGVGGSGCHPEFPERKAEVVVVALLTAPIISGGWKLFTYSCSFLSFFAYSPHIPVVRKSFNCT